VTIKEKIFPCLSCKSDTGCPNKLICDECRTIRKQKRTLVRGQKVPKKNSKLHLIKGIISEYTFTKLNNLKEYILEIELKFKEDKKRLNKRYYDNINGYGQNKEILDDIIEFYYEDHYKIENIFLTIFHYTSLVATYSFLESSLHSLCNHLHKMKNLSLELADLKNDGIERAKEYLIKVCHINFPEKSHEWLEIQKLNKVRNCIVHAEGNIEKVISKKKICNIVKNTPGLKIVNKRFIGVEVSYLNSVIKNIEEFLSKLYDIAFQVI